MTIDRPAFTRREFLGTSLTLASSTLAVPAFIHGSAHALHAALGGLSSAPGVPDERILVVVQLGGGNDGLNTIVPFGMNQYYKARPGIAIPEREALRLSGSDGIGLHPSMTSLRDLFDDGRAAIVQGVGYPNPNRSHFKSMDIWQTADTSATGDGWLGRYFDAECCGYGKGESGRPEGPAGTSRRAPPPRDSQAQARTATTDSPGVAIGRSAPLAMQGRAVKPIAFESAELFRWSGQDIHDSLRDPYTAIARREPSATEARPDSAAAFLMRTNLDAQVSSELIRKAVTLRPQTQFPGTDLGRQLSMVSSMIRAGLKTRVYYVTHGGFDTHSGQGGQQGRHANLLRDFANAVKAFHDEMKAQENDRRVVTMAFSEFGRRVAQNASQGTDHGTAAPMFLFGPMVRSGVHGAHPSLTDLDDGDLKYKIDFRSVYASLLDDWMKADSRGILGSSFRGPSLLKKA
ncbi:MAG: DUF1501 domain-containing protein [Phycisphaeraceae bacterium]|nr:DUF1501 domain-containing protein [Phycisphaerae bacterium]MBX3392085.1 DUF1501 domain-containing protein [Phycisphaeraceae bacterium]HRJ49139.1 DUF1501 domain-containing protein [Phycisphaerales bacterium]